MMPLTVELPPTPRPRQNKRWRWPSTRDAVSVGHCSSSNFGLAMTWLGLSDRTSSPASAGRQSGPASRRVTVVDGSSVSRAARTQPADPPPTIRWSATAA